MIFETFRQAIQNVWSNKLRTFLTMLGIIIGVMAVIVIVGLGNGMTKSMRDSFSALGTNTLSIQVSKIIGLCILNTSSAVNIFLEIKLILLLLLSYLIFVLLLSP